MDDLNYLLHREQAELMHAASAACLTSRTAHMALARAYARRIADHRLPYRSPRTMGATPFHPGAFGVTRSSPATLRRLAGTAE